MKYEQSVLVKNVSINDARLAFSDINFLNHLIALQPVKVIKWEGTFDGAFAHMKFWFFGWKDFSVKHNENFADSNSFSFKDQGSVLPFGLTKWEHTHTVVKEGMNIKIIDSISFESKSKLLSLLTYPVLIAPIFVRKLLYTTFSWKT